jgi:hypothetical protein
MGLNPIAAFVLVEVRVRPDNQYVPTLIVSGRVIFCPPVVTTSACGPAIAFAFTVNVALIDVGELTTTLLTASIPLGTVTVSPFWKLVLVPLIATVI